VSGNGNVGGIVGLNASPLSHCVALNQSITGTSSNYGRVVGYSYSTIAYQYAWDGMTARQYGYQCRSNKHKWRRCHQNSVNQALSWSTWFADFSTNWEMPAGELPNLKIFASDNVTMPVYWRLRSDATLS
jgi:hypothetical protein